MDAQPLGMRDQHGLDLYALVLTVTVAGGPARRVRIGSHVPAAAVPLLAEGTVVPVGLARGGDEDDVVIDWQAVLAQTLELGPGLRRTNRIAGGR